MYNFIIDERLLSLNIIMYVFIAVTVYLLTMRKDTISFLKRVEHAIYLYSYICIIYSNSKIL